MAVITPTERRLLHPGIARASQAYNASELPCASPKEIIWTSITLSRMKLPGRLSASAAKHPALQFFDASPMAGLLACLSRAIRISTTISASGNTSKS